MLRWMTGSPRGKSFIRRWIPQGARDLVNRLAGYAITYEGRYDTWQEAKMKGAGYDNAELVSRLLDAARAVRRGEAAWEQDGVTHAEIPAHFPLLAGLLRIVVERRIDCLRVVDFGGGFGSSYYQCRAHLPDDLRLEWSIVEQQSLVEAGRAEFETPLLRFYPTLEAVRDAGGPLPDVVLLSSVLQYLEYPYRLMDEIASMGIPYMLVDRHPCSFNGEVITVQRIPAALYKASYPSWLFDRRRFIERLGHSYELITQWEGKDPPIWSSGSVGAGFHGFLLRLRGIR